MALLRGRLLAGALFAGMLFGPQPQSNAGTGRNANATTRIASDSVGHKRYEKQRQTLRYAPSIEFARDEPSADVVTQTPGTTLAQELVSAAPLLAAPEAIQTAIQVAIQTEAQTALDVSAALIKARNDEALILIFTQL